MLGVQPDKNREPDMVEVLPFVHETRGGIIAVRLRDLADVDQRFRSDRLCDRPSQGRAGQRVRRVHAARSFNGEDFIAEAVERGAVAVVARPEAEVDGVPHLADAEPRRLFAELAAQILRALSRRRWSR